MLKNLKNIIDSSLYYYPSLYREDNYENSRISILNSLYCSYGNGTQWHKDGGFAHKRNASVSKKIDIPENFFECEMLELITFTKYQEESLPIFNILKENSLLNYSNNLPHYKSDKPTSVFLFENLDVLKLLPSFSDTTYNYNCAVMLIQKVTKFNKSPHQMCEYSKLVEMINGVTKSWGKDVYPNYFRKDFTQGGIDISNFIIKWHEENPPKEKNDFYNLEYAKKYLEKFVDKA